jgi:hypothetical protein
MYSEREREREGERGEERERSFAWVLKKRFCAEPLAASACEGKGLESRC